MVLSAMGLLFFFLPRNTVERMGFLLQISPQIHLESNWRSPYQQCHYSTKDTSCLAGWSHCSQGSQLDKTVARAFSPLATYITLSGSMQFSWQKKKPPDQFQLDFSMLCNQATVCGVFNNGVLSYSSGGKPRGIARAYTVLGSLWGLLDHQVLHPLNWSFV